MVKIQGPTEYERLDTLIAELCQKHGLKLTTHGWARKTYDVYFCEDRGRKTEHLARIESFATTSGEIRVYDERGMTFATELGEALEKDFGISETVLIREAPPD